MLASLAFSGIGFGKQISAYKVLQRFHISTLYSDRFVHKLSQTRENNQENNPKQAFYRPSACLATLCQPVSNVIDLMVHVNVNDNTIPLDRRENSHIYTAFEIRLDEQALNLGPSACGIN